MIKGSELIGGSNVQYDEEVSLEEGGGGDGDSIKSITMRKSSRSDVKA